jgi:phage terminase large subunit
VSTITNTLTARQEEFVLAALSGNYNEMLYGGAMGGGKTVVAVLLISLLCKMYPGSIWVFVRKDLNRMRNTVIRTWKRFAPHPFFAAINGSMVAKAVNGSEVHFMGEQSDTDPDQNRFRGLEVNGFVFEEANECLESTWNIAGMRAGRWKCPGGRQPKPLRIATCNPNTDWPKRRFYDPFKRASLTAPFYYLPAYMTDNPFLDADYLAALENIPEELRRVMIEGDWEQSDIPDQLIKPQWVERAIERGKLWVPEGRKSMGVDVARYGDDESVIAVQQGRGLISIKGYRKYDNVQLAKEVDATATADSIGNAFIKVDAIGNGSGVVDVLKHFHKRPVTEFIAGSRQITTGMSEKSKLRSSRFKNFRTEAWWDMRDAFFKDEYVITPAIRGPALLKLTEDLTSMKYSVDSDKFLELEGKEDTKKRLGRSPDYGDAAMQGYYQPAHARLWAGITAR